MINPIWCYLIMAAMWLTSETFSGWKKDALRGFISVLVGFLTTQLILEMIL